MQVQRSQASEEMNVVVLGRCPSPGWPLSPFPASSHTAQSRRSTAPARLPKGALQ